MVEKEGVDLIKDALAVAVAKRLKNGQTIGVGTGTTVEAVLKEIGRLVREGGFVVKAVPTSLQSAWLCEEFGLEVLYPGSSSRIDWGFDGADAVDRRLRVIKGKGGAMLQEKIMAARCKTYLIVIDRAKFVDDLACAAAVPVEVVPEAICFVEKRLVDLGARSIDLRKGVAKHGPVITERGNLILDVRFNDIEDDLEARIKSLVGVVDSGLFTNFATEIIVGSKSGIEVLTR